MLTDAQGIPLNATVTAANVNEVTQVFRVLTDMPAVGGKPGPKRQKPKRLQGDTGYDSGPVRQLLRWLGITPILAERGREARQRAGGVPLVCGADHLLAARFRATATTLGSAYGISRGVPPASLCPHLFAILGNLNSLLPDALSRWSTLSVSVQYS